MLIVSITIMATATSYWCVRPLSSAVVVMDNIIDDSKGSLIDDRCMCNYAL